MVAVMESAIRWYSGSMPSITASPPSASTDDLLAALDVVPDDVAVEVAAGGEDDAALRALRDAVREAHVFFRLVPVCQEEDVDRDPLASAEHRFAERGFFRPRVGRVEQVEHAPLEV